MFLDNMSKIFDFFVNGLLEFFPVNNLHPVLNGTLSAIYLNGDFNILLGFQRGGI